MSRSKAEKDHLSRIADMGCVICGGFAEIHHIRHGQGMGQRSSDFDAIGLCHAHHRTGGYGVALHMGQEAFERNFGTEVELLATVRNELGITTTGEENA